MAEVIIAMIVALTVLTVMFNTFISTQKGVDKGMRMLDYVRKATILLAYVKQDIRASVPEKEAVDPSKQGLTVRRTWGKDVVSVKYTFNKEEGYVTREAGSHRMDFGKEPGRGAIVMFAVEPEPRLPGFYRIEVAFETPEERRQNGAGGPVPADQAGQGGQGAPAPPRRPYVFRSLVNKRSSQGDERDIKWNYAYPE